MSMLRKEENYFVSAGNTDAMLGALDQALNARGMAPAQRTPMGIMTYGHYLGNGVTPHVAVTCFPGGQHVRFEVKGEVDSGNMTMFILLIVFFWPLALYFGFMAHQSFEAAANDLLAVMRQAATPYLASGGHPTAQGHYFPPAT